MLRVLVPTEVRQDTAGTVLRFDLPSDLSYHSEHLVEDGVVGGTEIGKGRHVHLWDDDDMDGPEGASVMEREHVRRLRHDRDWSSTAECLVTVEVV
jgi:hypothetical protein